MLAAAVLRCSPSQPPRQAGRSDLCSRHQHGSSGHSACFVTRVTQLCRMSQVCRTLAQCAETVALAAAHAPSGLPLMVTASIQPVPGHATRACLCQIGRRWLRRPFSRRPRNGAVLRCSVIKNLEQKAKTRFKSSKQRRRRRRRPRRRRRRRPPRRPGGVPCMIAARIQNASCVVTILTSVPAPRTPPRESAPPVMPLKHTPHHAAYIP